MELDEASKTQSGTPLPPKVREMMEETDELVYIAKVLRKRTKAYTKELSHIQKVSGNQMVREAARAQYNTLVRGGKISLDRFVSDLEASVKSVERSVKERISRFVRNAAILQLARAGTTKKIADILKKMDKASKSKMQGESVRIVRESRRSRFDSLDEASVPNLQDRVGKRQRQSEVDGLVTIDYTIDYQNPDNYDEVSITVSLDVDGSEYKQTIAGWDEAFEMMGNVESSVRDAYHEGLQDLLIDFSTAIGGGDPDYAPSAEELLSDDGTDGDRGTPDVDDVPYPDLKDRLTSMVDGIDRYVFDAVAEEVSSLGFVPTGK